MTHSSAQNNAANCTVENQFLSFLSYRMLLKPKTTAIALLFALIFIVTTMLLLFDFKFLVGKQPVFEVEVAVKEEMAPEPKQTSVVIYNILINAEERGYNTTRVLGNRERYCKSTGCDVYVQTKQDPLIVEAEKGAVWQKIIDGIHLTKSYDWTWFLDVDAFIMNNDTKLASMLDGLQASSENQIDLIIAKDCNGINAGSYFLRKSEWTETFLQKWLSLMLRSDYENASLYQEQAALTELVRINWDNADKHILFVDQNLINSYLHAGCGHQYQNGEFVIHNPGFGYKNLIDYMKKDSRTEF